MEDMTKKAWSVVLLCVLAVLLIVLCAVGFKIQKSLETLEYADASNGVIPGAGMLTLVYANLSLYFGGGEGSRTPVRNSSDQTSTRVFGL